ncbi:hypothetical protein GJW-30_1_02978 [Variibacter gotjawalensis]|uniref:Uncharacterized protein n=1 Tax=Variibacter gotjawalensis TaxID=1333996 RepID=A0A0S3PX19_9BRAD|nr:hypothetical protein [Variibacter gotjawalensis]NIK46263.1 hypothetical protein [Variibacter gotjawalensis]RZS48178.1 hypothetical protein EV661_0581 [Variibacter gotjawalensis]BAT60435.1 hypothetical protein GJW-30_1_02978 [Variibacter gotjawalensis]
MGLIAKTILGLAIAGAFASWIVGAVYFARSLASMNAAAGPSRWMAVAAWPFATKQIKGAAAENAAVVNKAIIVFFLCLTLAVLTISLSTNYNRIAK